MWEIISAISGTISAVCDIRGSRKEPGTFESNAKTDPCPKVTRTKSHAFLQISTAWCLGVVGFVCIDQPYGMFISEREYAELFGWLISLPAFLLFFGALDASTGTDKDPSAKSDPKDNSDP